MEMPFDHLPESQSTRLSVKDAAARIGVHEQTIRRAIARGDLPAVRQSRSFLINSGDLTEYADRRHNTNASSRRQRQQTKLIRHPLPRRTVELIGRSGELTLLQRLLEQGDASLITVTGPGGVGKTVFALTAARVVTHFTDGIWFIELASIRDPVRVLPTIAAALGIPDHGRISLAERVHSAIAGRKILLILDNLEQVIESALDLSRLLHACPDVTILATSRTKLELANEVELPLAPLDLTARNNNDPFGSMALSDAAHLFILQARETLNEFAITPEVARTVQQICARLDGLPLAIELAAARLTVLSPYTMLARLETRLPLLVNRSRDRPERHQTLRRTIGWSYDLLTPSQQNTFRVISLFAGSCTLEAVEALVIASQRLDLSDVVPESEVIDDIAALLSGNLLVHGQAPDHERRFSMLETVREFAFDELDKSGQAELVRQAHAAFYLSLVEQTTPVLYRSISPESIVLLAKEHENIRAAFETLCRPETATECMRLAAACGYFWYVQGHVREGRQRLDRALALGAFHSEAAIGGATLWAAELALAQGDLETASSHAKRSLGIWSNLENLHCRVAALHVLAIIEERQLHLDAAARLLAEELEIWRELKEEHNIAMVLMLIGSVAYGQGELDRAEQREIESRDIFLNIAQRSWAAIAIWHLGLIAEARGNALEAARKYREALSIFIEGGDPLFLHKALPGLASMAIKAGLPVNAANLLGATNAQINRSGAALYPWDQSAYDRAEQQTRATLGGSRYRIAYSAGAQLLPEGLLDLANSIVGILESMERVNPADNHPAPTLTARERQVLGLLATGMTDREIAQALFIGHRTVNTHVANIIAHFQVHSRRQAIRQARECGLIPGLDRSD